MRRCGREAGVAQKFPPVRSIPEESRSAGDVDLIPVDIDLLTVQNMCTFWISFCVFFCKI